MNVNKGKDRSSLAAIGWHPCLSHAHQVAHHRCTCRRTEWLPATPEHPCGCRPSSVQPLNAHATTLYFRHLFSWRVENKRQINYTILQGDVLSDEPQTGCDTSASYAQVAHAQQQHAQMKLSAAMEPWSDVPGIKLH